MIGFVGFLSLRRIVTLLCTHEVQEVYLVKLDNKFDFV